MKFLENEKQIKEIINDVEIKTIQLIMGENKEEVCMVIGTELFSTPYLIPYDKRQFVYDELWDTKTKIFFFTDAELSEAWKESYIKGGIDEDRWDRRVEFHSYDDMNEMFCIDTYTLEEILDISQHCISDWKIGIIEWYRRKLLN